eukprot:gnl/TRDRNA2_/TRDRNA2_170593_c2_seq19.p1 gnl/TRDRNA2_/TRDRNA2_170593_c2~~gnl/TRDRNA2_/TRDRNA2_170593_c2_seq19.p1  ORF type:complete len:570 (-),score=186.89 gnl/TRDRNA2_/TRDRNA2_170593_c2_seq19:156-1865(-)
MKETISALTEALDVLSKVQLLQKNKKDAHKVKPLLLQLEHIIKDSKLNFKMVLQKDFWDVMSEMGADAPASSPFLPKTVLNQQPSEGGAAAGAKSYNSASGQIVGVLGGMKDEFEKDLATAEKEEATALESFQKLEAAKQSEISAATAQKKSKESLLADTTRKKAEAEEDLETTKAALSSDQQFLVDMTANCKEQDQAYAARTKVRNQELLALSETLKILTADSARDTFGKTMDFLQINQENSGVQTLAAAQKKAVRAAFAKILKIARKNGNWMLASLAVRTNLDAFEKVKEAIDDMVETLSQEQKDEIEHRDSCIKDLHNNERDTEKELHSKKTLESNIDGLKMTIHELDKAIELFKSEIEDLEIQIKRAGEDRELENQEYRTVVADQRATQELLHKAIDTLKAAYAFPQKSNHAVMTTKVASRTGQEPPAEFEEYEKSSSANGIVRLMEQILWDAKQMEVEATHDEDQSQKAYEAFHMDSKESIKAKEDGITNKTEEKAQADQELLTMQTEFDDTMTTLEDLSKTKGDLHGDCDYFLKNFETRQTARAEEIEALKQAKAMLSGMKPN